MADQTETAVPPGPGSISTHATGAMTSQKATDGSAAGESPAQSQPAECYVPAAAILRMVERAMQFPYPTICRHLVAADLLSTLEEHGYRMPEGLAHAVVNAHDEDALAILQGQTP